MSISRPRVLFKTDPQSGQRLEPIEEVIVDVDEEFAGIVVDKMSRRKAEMQDMRPSGGGKLRLSFLAPTRGLIGYHGEFLTDTRGSGVMSRLFHGYAPYKGPIEGRRTGVLISNSQGAAVAYALWNLEERGPIFITPGAEVYAGMIIGAHSRGNDLDVNPRKGKQLTNIRTTAKDEAVRLTPPVQMSLEEAIAYIEEDELVEVTAKAIRLAEAPPGHQRSAAREPRGGGGVAPAGRWRGGARHHEYREQRQPERAEPPFLPDAPAGKRDGERGGQAAAGRRRVKPRPRRRAQTQPQQAEKEREQRRARRAEFEPQLQRRVMRVQRQPGLSRPDLDLAAGDRPRRIEAPAEERPLGDAVAGKRPDQEAVSRGILERIDGGENRRQVRQPRQGQRRGQDGEHRERCRDAGDGAAPEVQQRRDRQAQAERELRRSVVERVNGGRHHRSGAQRHEPLAAADQQRSGRQDEEGQPGRDLVETRSAEGTDRDMPAQIAGARQIVQGERDADRGPGKEAERQPPRRGEPARGCRERKRGGEQPGESRGDDAGCATDRSTTPPTTRPIRRARRESPPGGAARGIRKVGWPRSARPRTARQTRPRAPRRAARGRAAAAARARSD